MHTILAKCDYMQHIDILSVRFKERDDELDYIIVVRKTAAEYSENDIVSATTSKAAVNKGLLMKENRIYLR